MSPLSINSAAIREAREARGLTQSELAERAQTYQATISLLESGQGRRVDFDVLDRVAKALGLNPLLLFTDDGPPPKAKPRRAGR